MEREELEKNLDLIVEPSQVIYPEAMEIRGKILAEFDAFILDVEHWRRKWSEAEARAAGLKEERDEQEKRGKNLDEMIFKIGKALGLDAIPGYILTATNDFVREIKAMKDGRDIAREALAKSRALVQQLNDRLQEANQTIRDRPDIHYQILDSLFVHGEAFVYDGEVLDPAKVVIHRKKKELSEDLKEAVERRVKSLMLLIRAGSFPLIAIEVRKLVESGLKFAGEGPVFPYILKADRDKPPEEQTVFYLRNLPPGELKARVIEASEYNRALETLYQELDTLADLDSWEKCARCKGAGCEPEHPDCGDGSGENACPDCSGHGIVPGDYQARGKAAKFVEHIRAHLKEGDKVLCKICDKTLEEIALEETTP